MSIEGVPRWWPGLVGGGGGIFNFGGGVHWIRLNDDDPIVMQKIPHTETPTLERRHLGLGDAVEFSDGELWGCMRGGSYKTARMVKARRV